MQFTCFLRVFLGGGFGCKPLKFPTNLRIWSPETPQKQVKSRKTSETGRILERIRQLCGYVDPRPVRSRLGAQPGSSAKPVIHDAVRISCVISVGCGRLCSGQTLQRSLRRTKLPNRLERAISAIRERSFQSVAMRVRCACQSAGSS